MGYDLKGKVVFITGASSGIGAAAAQAYVRAGARLALGARRFERCESLAKALQLQGHEALALRCAVREDESVSAALAAAASHFGGIDVLVNNAGVGLYGRVEELTPALLHENFETNVYGALRCLRAALPYLRQRGGGQIVNVSSVLGHRSLPGMGGYCASKFALNGLTEALRLELAAEGIDVILVSPGVTATAFRESAMTASGERESRAPFEAMRAEVVGAAMVKASQRRKREVVLTLTGRAMVAANRVSPGLFDRVARRMVGPGSKG